MRDYQNQVFEGLLTDSSEDEGALDAFDAQVAAGCTCTSSCIVPEVDTAG